MGPFPGDLVVFFIQKLVVALQDVIDCDFLFDNGEEVRVVLKVEICLLIFFEHEVANAKIVL